MLETHFRFEFRGRSAVCLDSLKKLPYERHRSQKKKPKAHERFSHLELDGGFQTRTGGARASQSFHLRRIRLELLTPSPGTKRSGLRLRGHPYLAPPAPRPAATKRAPGARAGTEHASPHLKNAASSVAVGMARHKTSQLMQRFDSQQTRSFGSVRWPLFLGG